MDRTIGAPPFVATKVKPKDVSNWRFYVPMAEQFTRASIIESVETSLRTLGIECVDLLQIHQWYYRWSHETEWLEALRVLRPGGYFCYTDGCWADDDCSEELLDLGFELLERLEITTNVLHALRKDSARRATLFDAMRNRELREEYKHWGGVVGYRAYNRFEAGQTRYFSHRLRKPL